MTTAELVRPARSRPALNRLHGHRESRFYRDRLSMIAAVGSSRAVQVVRPLVSSTSSAAIRADPAGAGAQPRGQAVQLSLPVQPAGGGLQLRVQVVQVPAEPALQLGLDPDQVLAVISQELDLLGHRVVRGGQQACAVRAAASAQIGSDFPRIRADCRVAAVSFGGTRTIACPAASGSPGRADATAIRVIAARSGTQDERARNGVPGARADSSWSAGASAQPRPCSARRRLRPL